MRDNTDGTDAVVILIPEAINLCPTLGEGVVKDLGEALMPKKSERNKQIIGDAQTFFDIDGPKMRQHTPARNFFDVDVSKMRQNGQHN